MKCLLHFCSLQMKCNICRPSFHFKFQLRMGERNTHTPERKTMRHNERNLKGFRVSDSPSSSSGHFIPLMLYYI